jgi:hypothetical protein
MIDNHTLIVEFVNLQKRKYDLTALFEVELSGMKTLISVNKYLCINNRVFRILGLSFFEKKTQT